jgi:hypothetical protein
VSYTLWVFKGPIPSSEQDFVDRLGRFDSGDEAIFDAGPELAAFYDELLRRHPALEGLPDNKIDDSVWSMTPKRSERLLTLDCVWPEAEAGSPEWFDRSPLTLDQSLRSGIEFTATT